MTKITPVTQGIPRVLGALPRTLDRDRCIYHTTETPAAWAQLHPQGMLTGANDSPVTYPPTCTCVPIHTHTHRGSQAVPPPESPPGPLDPSHQMQPQPEEPPEITARTWGSACGWPEMALAMPRLQKCVSEGFKELRFFLSQHRKNSVKGRAIEMICQNRTLVRLGGQVGRRVCSQNLMGEGYTRPQKGQKAA